MQDRERSRHSCKLLTFYANRRRPICVRTDRSRQRAQRRLRDGRPSLTALAIAAFPKDAERDILRSIFRGGLDKLREAGVALLGGHTVQDSEIKFGYAITGEVDPSRCWQMAARSRATRSLLTKPIGTGIIATALKFGRAPQLATDAATHLHDDPVESRGRRGPPRRTAAGVGARR